MSGPSAFPPPKPSPPSDIEALRRLSMMFDSSLAFKPPVPVPVVTSEPLAPHLPELESQVIESSPNLANSPQPDAATLPIIEQASKLSDSTEPQLTATETPDMTGSNRTLPHGSETDETRPLLPEPTHLDASVNMENVSNSQIASRNMQRSSRELSPLSPLPQSPANPFPREDIVNEVLDLMDQVASTALFGPIGVGKSSMALTLLHHNRIQAKYGVHRYFMRCDTMTNSLDGFLKGLSDATHINRTMDLAQLRLHLESSPPLILLLDSVDLILDPLAPEAEEISAAIEEFGSYEHVCLLTTSSMCPDIPGFHRVEVPILSEGDARDAFYSLCNVEKSPAVDDLISRLDFHPLSIDLLASSVRENDWDESTLLKSWDDDQTSPLKIEYHQRLKDAVEPLLRSPTVQDLGNVAVDILGAVAAFPRGIEVRRLQNTPTGITGVGQALDVLCKFFLIYRQDGLVKMISPLRFYFLESMLEPPQHVEVIRWDAASCNAAKAWLPVYTRGPPQMPMRHSPSLEDWIERLRSMKRKLLALFGLSPVPANLNDMQEDPTNVPSDSLPRQISPAPTAYEVE